MADSRHALYNPGGTLAFDLAPYAPLPAPLGDTWVQEPVDEALDGSPIYGLYAEVTWDFTGYRRGVPLALVDLIGSLRESDGTIRFKTPDAGRQFVICTGKIDLLLPHAYNAARGRAYGLTIQFRRVAPVV